MSGLQAAAIALTFSAMLVFVVQQPLAWGVAGALVYASQQLAAVIFGDHPALAAQRFRAWVQFVVSVFFGGLAAQGFGPTLADYARNLIRPEAVWLFVGLSANGAWPAIERVAIGRILRQIGGRVESLGATMDGDKPRDGS